MCSAPTVAFKVVVVNDCLGFEAVAVGFTVPGGSGIDASDGTCTFTCHHRYFVVILSELL